MSQKRNRSVNWEEEEKQLLRDVIKDYAYILENKCLKTDANKAKIKAWEDIHKKFNEINRRTRELVQLQIQWKRMKLNAKKNRISFRRESSKTGDPLSPFNDDREVADLTNARELLNTDYNSYDSDGVFNAPIDDDVPPHKIIKIIAKPDVTTLRNDPVNKEKNVLINQNCTTDLLNHSEKLKEIEHQRRMEMAEEEHSLKMRTMRENYKSAVLEREILEIRKTLEERKLMSQRDGRERFFIKNINDA